MVATLVFPNPGAESETGGLKRSIRQRRIPALHSQHRKGVLRAYEGVGPLLAIRGKITVIELVTVEALMSAAMVARISRGANGESGLLCEPRVGPDLSLR